MAKNKNKIKNPEPGPKYHHFIFLFFVFVALPLWPASMAAREGAKTMEFLRFDSKVHPKRCNSLGFAATGAQNVAIL